MLSSKRNANNGPAGRLFWLVSLFLFIAAPLSAQSGPSGSLSGTVTDQNGGLVAGVTVTVKNANTGLTRTATSGEDGRWSVPVLPVGAYSVIYTAGGFKKTVREAVEVEASVPRVLEDRMEIGDVAATVDVTSNEAPLITPESAAVARQITGEEVVKLPTPTRSFTGLLSAEAGVSTDLSPVATNGNGNQSPSVNGTRTTSTSFFFNGIDATNITTNEGSLSDNISPAPETLQEVKLQTSLYDASTGRSGGGNFQLVTKAGGNKFNGSAYYYLQNKALNANDFFFNKEGLEKPQASRNEGGFTIGGPVVQNRFFFFGGYQYTKANTGFVPTARSTSVLPLALGRITGARTAQNLADAFNATNGCVAGVNCLTAADISPIALRLLNLQNPVTGGFVIPAPRPGARIIGVDRAGARGFQFGAVGTGGVATRTLQENNPLAQQLNVQPSSFEQNQFTVRLDANLTAKDTLSGTLFYANFPGFDSFPDPSSLVSPFTLRRDDRNRTLALSETHIFSPTLINEARFGMFRLNNTRSLDDPFLTDEFTSAAVGIQNPALLFDNSLATRRLGHFIGRPGTPLSQFSFGGPNDSFNRRFQQTFSFSDNVTLVWGRHNTRFGGEFKRHSYKSNLPEEQATEFEKYDSFTQFLTGNATEADTQFGITDKEFRFRDYGFYLADDWKISRRLTLNVGLRYELFMWPEEKDGRIGNADIAALSDCFGRSSGTLARCDNPLPVFLVPNNVRDTGLANVDGSVAITAKANNRHTLNGQDTNNFAPRVGFAFSPFESNRLVVRGGYGVFFDRPSAAFINTVFSNYPFLREVEITVPNGNVPIGAAFSAQPTNVPLSNWLPFRVTRTAGAGGSYVIRDNTGVTTDPRGNATLPGNIAETFEFRAVDRNLRTPYVQQWNLGFQYEVTKGLVFEARYIGTKGRSLLQAVAFNQGYDLNDPNTPDHIYERFNQAYVAAGAPRGPLNTGATARERGLGLAFGFANPFRTGQAATCNGATLVVPTGATVDLNLANPLTCSAAGVLGGGQVINFEARVPILGFNVPEALLLQSNAFSNYHGAQFGLNKRFSNGLQFNLAYTWSKSLDNNSSDPGSTAGSGKPDVPNTGFVAQGDQRNLDNNKAVSDFDRTHRFSANFVYNIPTFGRSNRFVNGWQVSGFFQAQTGTPYSIFAPEPEIGTAPQYRDLVRGSGGLFRLGFGRPGLCGSLNDLRQQGADITEGAFNGAALCSPLGGNGSLGRNVLRAPMQNRFDLGLAKQTKITEKIGFEFGLDIFNLFNRANFAAPDSELGSPDFGRITNTVGGPRVMQFRAKLKF
jgi:hypothetical protein